MSLKETIHWFSNIQHSIIMPGHQVMALDTANRRIAEGKGSIKVNYNTNRMLEKNLQLTLVSGYHSLGSFPLH